MAGSISDMIKQKIHDELAVAEWDKVVFLAYLAKAGLTPPSEPTREWLRECFYEVMNTTDPRVDLIQMLMEFDALLELTALLKAVL